MLADLPESVHLEGPVVFPRFADGAIDLQKPLPLLVELPKVGRHLPASGSAEAKVQEIQGGGPSCGWSAELAGDRRHRVL